MEHNSSTAGPSLAGGTGGDPTVITLLHACSTKVILWYVCATALLTSCCLGCTSTSGPKAEKHFAIPFGLVPRTCFWDSFSSQQEPKQTDQEQLHDRALKAEDAADVELTRLISF
jgi:hypothetical protein